MVDPRLHPLNDIIKLTREELARLHRERAALDQQIKETMQRSFSAQRMILRIDRGQE